MPDDFSLRPGAVRMFKINPYHVGTSTTCPKPGWAVRFLDAQGFRWVRVDGEAPTPQALDRREAWRHSWPQVASDRDARNYAGRMASLDPPSTNGAGRTHEEP
jgi:hypothetical protein